MSRKTVMYRYEPQPQPKPKKQVRFALPTKSVSVLPTKSVSDRPKSSSKPSRHSDNRRSSKGHSTCKPILVAAGLSTVAAALNSKKDRSRTKVPQRSHPPPPPPAPRKEVRSSGRGESYPKPSKPTFGFNGFARGDDWTRGYRKTTYVYYQ